MIGVMIFSFIIQQTLNARFDKYSRIPTRGALTGAEVAAKMLRDNGITDVKIVSVPGMLTDHYNPDNKTVNLSEGVYSQRSIAAAAVAAHETGHAIQHAVGYGPLKLRSTLVPVVTFANRTVTWVILLGLLVANFLGPSLLYIGIGLFAATTLFSFITLPVEINASHRALEWLNGSGISDFETQDMAADALKWAALTYVIAALGSLATLFYYIGLARRN